MTKGKKASPKAKWKDGLTKTKAKLKKADEGVKVQYKWTEKKIQQTVDGLMTAFYIINSTIATEYVKKHAWVKPDLKQAKAALSTARRAFYHSLEAFERDEDDYWDDEEEDWDDDFGF